MRNDSFLCKRFLFPTGSIILGNTDNYPKLAFGLGSVSADTAYNLKKWVPLIRVQNHLNNSYYSR